VFLSIQCVVMFDIPFNHFNALLWIFFVYRHQMLSHTLYITNSFQEIHSALWLFCASNYLFHNTLPYWAYWQWHSLVLLTFVKVWTVYQMNCYFYVPIQQMGLDALCLGVVRLSIHTYMWRASMHINMHINVHQGFHASLKILDFFSEFWSTWKFLEIKA